jgi:hypothetical protein
MNRRPVKDLGAISAASWRGGKPGGGEGEGVVQQVSGKQGVVVVVVVVVVRRGRKSGIPEKTRKRMTRSVRKMRSRRRRWRRRKYRQS